MKTVIALALLVLTLTACSPSPSPSTVPTQTPAAATPSPAAEEPRFQFQATALERIDASGRTLWRASLPAEKNRQMAVLGETVLVWGPSNNLRRFAVDTGSPTGLTLALGQVALFGVHDDILVQSADAGLAGIAEKSNIWHRSDLRAESMVVAAGPESDPVVLLVSRNEGRARAVKLKDGKDSSFPVPSGVFSKVAFQRDAGAIIWTPKGGGEPVQTDASTGLEL
jgi:hypothetical protein